MGPVPGQELSVGEYAAPDNWRRPVHECYRIRRSSRKVAVVFVYMIANTRASRGHKKKVPVPVDVEQERRPSLAEV